MCTSGETGKISTGAFIAWWAGPTRVCVAKLGAKECFVEILFSQNSVNRFAKKRFMSAFLKVVRVHVSKFFVCSIVVLPKGTPLRS